jgi:4'-phosphopantetheinyl transferase
MEPSSARARSGQAHVRSAWVDEPLPLGEQLELLDDDEQARAARFRFERDRHRFVARRAFLRRVLGDYICIAPRMIRYRISPNGRPELEPSRGVSFSISHSDGLATVAVASDRLVGVDIERIRPIQETLELAHRLLSRREYEHLLSVTESARSDAFLRLWTRKEAYVKAVGVGLSMPFDGFDVLLGADGRAHVPPGPSGGPSFVLTSLDGLPGYVGTVAVSGTAVTPRNVAQGRIA